MLDNSIKYIDSNYGLSISIPKNVIYLQPVYDKITDEITGNLFIEYNNLITKLSSFNCLTNVGKLLSITGNMNMIDIIGFDNLTNIGNSLFIYNNESLISISGFCSLINVGVYIAFEHNKSLTSISGFDILKIIKWCLCVNDNPKLVTMSIPGNLVRAVDYGHGYGIKYDNDLKFKSPGDFINSPEIMDDLVTKFNPGDHGDQVVKQIIENVEEWGTEETKLKVYSLLGKYMTPEQLKLAPTHIQYHYHPDSQGTTGRDVAKVNAGEVYGMF